MSTDSMILVRSIFTSYEREHELGRHGRDGRHKRQAHEGLEVFGEAESKPLSISA